MIVFQFIALLIVAGPFLVLLIELTELLCLQFYLSVAKKKEAKKQLTQLTAQQLLLITVGGFWIAVFIGAIVINMNKRKLKHSKQ